MALFANLNKRMSIMRIVELDKGIKSNFNHHEEKVNENYMTDYFDDAKYENLTTVPLDTYDDEENKKFWMNVLKPSKLVREVVDGIKNKIKLLEFCIAILSIVSILISQIEYEIEYYPKHYKPSCYITDSANYRGQPVRITISILCFIMAIMTIYNSLLFYRQKKEEKKIISSNIKLFIIVAKFIYSYYFKRMLLEVLIIVIHPLPYVDFCFRSQILSEMIDYRMATFFYALMFLKLFTFLRIVAAYTKYSNSMSSRYCDLFGSEAGTFFALKAVQKDHPFLILIFNFCSVSVVLGILLRMFEILHYNNEFNKMNYNFFSNGIWNIIVAMTTVGYGELYPKTHIGRFIVVVAIIIGTLLVSLTIVALNRLTSLENNELQAYIILNRLSIKKALEKIFVKNLRTRLQIYILRRHKKIKALTQDKEYMKLIRELRAITEEKREMKRLLYKDSFSNEEHKFLTLSDRIHEKVEFIGDNLKMIQSYKNKIKAQLNSQKKLMTNIDASLKLFRNCIRPGYFQLFAKNPSFVMNDTYLDEAKFLATINFMSKDEIKELALKQIEGIFFNNPIRPSSKIIYDSEDNQSKDPDNLMFNNLLMKHVQENFQKLKEKYSAEDYNALDDSIDSTNGHDKDIVIAEYQKIHELDNKSKQIYYATSKKTLDLISSLHSIKFKNALVSSKNPDLNELTKNLPEKVDIFDNMIDDQEAKKLELESDEKEANNQLIISNQIARRGVTNNRSTLKPLDLAYEKLLNLSPVDAKNKFSKKQSDEDFANNFKIKLIDLNPNNVIDEKQEDVFDLTLNEEAKEKKESIVQIKNSNNKKSINSGRESYMGFMQNFEMSPIKEKDKNQNEDIVMHNDQSIVKSGDISPNKEEKLKKKLNETLMFLKNPKLSNLNVKSSLMGRLNLTKDLNTKK